MTDSLDGQPVLQEVGAEDRIERERAVEETGLEIGRDGADLAYPDDRAMAPRHARVEIRGDRVEVSDCGEGSGVWLRVQGSGGRVLREGDQVWLGSQLLVVVREGGVWRVRHHGPDGRLRETLGVPADGVFIGRGSEWVLDRSDNRLSRRHAQLVVGADGLQLYDRGAHNGTFVKLRGSEALAPGSEFRLATRQFRLVMRRVRDASEDVPVRRKGGLAARLRQLGTAQSATASAAVDAERTVISEPIDPDAALPEGPSANATDSSTPTVLLVIDGEESSVSLEVAVGTTILEAVQAAGLERGQPIDWECGDGRCGVCAVAIEEGADRLEPPDPATGEMKTIQVTEQVVPDPKRYRLACLARVRGTVRVRSLS